MRGARVKASCRSDAARTRPPHPASIAHRIRSGATWSSAVSSLVSTVTASALGAVWPAFAAPSARPSTPARIMSTPPWACSVRNVAPSPPSTRAARPTVVGMSCSFRSQNTSKPKSVRLAMALGPVAENNSRPTFTTPKYGISARALRSACTMSSVSSTRHMRLRTEGGAQCGSCGESSGAVEGCAATPVGTDTPPWWASVRSTTRSSSTSGTKGLLGGCSFMAWVTSVVMAPRTRRRRA